MNESTRWLVGRLMMAVVLAFLFGGLAAVTVYEEAAPASVPLCTIGQQVEDICVVGLR